MELSRKEAALGQREMPDGKKPIRKTTTNRRPVPSNLARRNLPALRSSQGIALGPNSASYGIAVGAQTQGAVSVLAMEEMLIIELERDEALDDELGDTL